ncbi:hypothetical protein H1R20_g1471, partial [Candolleomyces eurysporus]
MTDSTPSRILPSYPADRAKLLFDINVNGVFYTAREGARRMIPKKKGSIILVGSMSANIVNTPQFQTPYNASKAAVKHMAASLAVEWAPHNIRVNCLSPGYMLTKLTRTVLEGNAELKNTWEKLTPMGRMGEPEDLAAIAGPTSLPNGTGQYDYTKRKRWGDLISSEVVETVAFVVNSSLTVLLCGAAICELLGWRDADFLDTELTEYMDEADQDAFREWFDLCFQKPQPNDSIQVNMRVNSTSIWPSVEVITVEFKGAPQVIPLEDEPEMVVVALHAGRAPTRHLESFSEYASLQMERLELERLLEELRVQAGPETLTELASSRIASEESNSFYTSSNMAAARTQEDEDPSGRNPEGLFSQTGSSPLANPASTGEEDQEDGGPKKKKLKKSNPNEKHVCVTCGNTESPEWRKGPLGPKTLCNACGLRWAKQNRKPEDPDTAAGNTEDASSSKEN